MEWTYLDIGTYIDQNKHVFILFFMLGIAFSVISIPIKQEFNLSNAKTLTIWSMIIILFMMFGSVAAFFPTHNKILEVKIAKIKNEAVTRENLNKGVERIDETLKALECEYLNICKDKNEK